jgi:hypothetical protein
VRPLLNVTLPPSAAPDWIDTVAVYVTVLRTVTGFTLDVRAIVVGGAPLLFKRTWTFSPATIRSDWIRAKARSTR